MEHRDEPPPTGLHWLALAVAIGASQIGQMLLKAGATGLPEMSSVIDSMIAQLVRSQTMLGLGFYAGGTLLYLVALRRIPMSVALPCTAVSFAVAALAGVLLFGEPMTGQHILGLAMICLGVTLLAGTTASAEPPVPEICPDCGAAMQVVAGMPDPVFGLRMGTHAHLLECADCGRSVTRLSGRASDQSRQGRLRSGKPDAAVAGGLVAAPSVLRIVKTTRSEPRWIPAQQVISASRQQIGR